MTTLLSFQIAFDGKTLRGSELTQIAKPEHRWFLPRDSRSQTLAKLFTEIVGNSNRERLPFTEDASRIRKGIGPEMTSVFRQLALTILQQDTTVKASIRGKRKLCGWSEPAFERLIAGFCGN